MTDVYDLPKRRRRREQGLWAHRLTITAHFFTAIGTAKIVKERRWVSVGRFLFTRTKSRHGA